MEYDDVLKRAREIVEERKPQASPQKKAAFSNLVAYLVTGISGGYGGPSVREHAVARLYAGGQYPFEEAVELLLKPDGLIFGPLTDIHRDCWEEEYCFDDDPEDIAELRKED